MAEKPTPVSVEARRLDISILPGNFSIPLKDFMVGQNDDIQNVADKANEASNSAYEANLTNEEQDEILAAHSETLEDHERRVDTIETTVADHEARIGSLEGRMTTAESDIDSLQATAADHETRIGALEYAVTRKKSELVFSGISLAITTTPTNLITLLKALTPTSGTFAPFFNTTSDKMVVFNENKSLNFKLALVGSWPGGTGNRSMQLTFSGAVPDTLVNDRTSITTTDNVLLATFFSVDVGGFLALNGSTMTIKSNGATFTATTVKLIAEQ